MGRYPTGVNRMRMIRWVVTLLITTASTQAAEPAGTGASMFWTSQDSIVTQARDLLEQGRFAEAEKLLARAQDQPKPGDVQARAEGVEIIRRIRREYDLTAERLLDRLRSAIPDVAAADLERWRQASQVQHRIIDGAVCYFRREPANIWRFCDEAQQRRISQQGHRSSPSPSTFANNDERLFKHLEQVIAQAERTGRVEVVPIKHTIRHKLIVKPNRPGARAGSLVRCWLGYAQAYRQQRHIRLIRTSPAEHVIAPNVVDGYPLGGAPQRTIYLEHKIVDPAQEVIFEVEFEFVTSAYYPIIDDAQARPLSEDYHGGFLEERLPHIRFSGPLKQTVEQLVAGEPNPLARARRIFHWIAKTGQYCAEQEYSTIPSLSEKMFTVRKGDCGLQAMLFITLCRLAGIPARWQSGWVTFPDAWNMHDWAEFYVEPWGWLPADVSYGLKTSDNPKIREFYFGHQDSYRLIVNCDYGSRLHPPKADLRSEPADFQRGEVEIDGRNLYFDEWDYKFDFDLGPIDE